VGFPGYLRDANVLPSLAGEIEALTARKEGQITLLHIMGRDDAIEAVVTERAWDRGERIAMKTPGFEVALAIVDLRYLIRR
jgi:hypothetical protein